MKTRLINGKKTGNYSDEWLSKNANEIINGQKVSEWDLIDFVDEEEKATYMFAKNMKFRLALIKIGISIKSIDDAIDLMPEGKKKEIIYTLWNYSDFLERNDSNLIEMAEQFGISSEQLDQLFKLANE
jgi:hypothetical protein